MALDWAREAGARLRGLVDEDSRGLRRGDRRLPASQGDGRGEGGAQGGGGDGHVGSDRGSASDRRGVPRRAARGAARPLAHGNPNATSDAQTAGALAWAGLLGAAENVKINVGPGADPAGDDVDRVDALVAEGRSLFASLGLPS